MKPTLSLQSPKLLAIAASISLFGFSGIQDADAQSILYICGDQKGYPGVAFDHGLIDYIETKYASGTVTPTLSSETPGTSTQGLYDPDNPTVTQSYDFNTFDCVILSSTVSTHYVSQLMTDLNATSTNLLLMSEESLVELHMVDNTSSSMEGSTTVHNGTTDVGITNYPGVSVLGYGDNYWNEAEAFAWKDAASNTAGTNSFFFSYDQGEVVDPGTPFTMQGDRIFFGLSEGTDVSTTTISGVWEDTTDNDIVDDSENFDPDTHLTAAGKTMLDQALGLHVVPEAGTTTLSMLTILLIGGRRRRQS